MSQTVANLLAQFRRLGPADQQAAVSAILSAWDGQAELPAEASPHGTSRLRDRPDYPFDNDRERAILAERMATLDDTVSFEELRRRVEAGVQRLLAAPSPGSGATGTAAAPPVPRI